MEWQKMKSRCEVGWKQSVMIRHGHLVAGAVGTSQDCRPVTHVGFPHGSLNIVELHVCFWQCILTHFNCINRNWFKVGHSIFISMWIIINIIISYFARICDHVSSKWPPGIAAVPGTKLGDWTIWSLIQFPHIWWTRRWGYIYISIHHLWGSECSSFPHLTLKL